MHVYLSAYSCKANRPLSNVLLHKHGQYFKMLFLKILPSANYRLVFAQTGTYSHLDMQQLQVGEQTALHRKAFC